MREDERSGWKGGMGETREEEGTKEDGMEGGWKEEKQKENTGKAEERRGKRAGKRGGKTEKIGASFVVTLHIASLHDPPSPICPELLNAPSR